MATLLDHLFGAQAFARARSFKLVDIGIGPTYASRGPAARTARALRRLAQGRQARLIVRGALMMLARAALLAGGLAVAAALLASHRRPTGAALAAAAVPQAWSDVIHPIALYDLSGTDFAKLPRSYRARRHAPDGAREDVMSFGALGRDKPYLRVTLLRSRGVGSPEAEPLADALARTAGVDGETVTRIRALPPVETRFGRIDRADLLLWKGDTGTACSGFRGLPDGGRVLRIAGFGCGAPGRPLAADAIACAIDRIDLVSAGEDRPLRAVFVAAERRAGPASCGGGVLAAVADPQPAPGPLEALRQRAAWLDANAAAPALRGPIATAGDDH